MQERQSERLEVGGSVLCDVAGRLSRDELCDLSAFGCKLRHVDSGLAVGSRLELTLVGDIEIGGTVRWVDDRYAGIEFDTPLSQAAVLYFTLPDCSRNTRFVPLDGFGRRLPPLGRLGDIGAAA